MIPPSVLPPPALAIACSAQPSTKAFVVAGIDPLVMGSTLDLAQLANMSKKAAQIGKHPPYGFYLGAVAYEISVDIGNDSRDLCKGPVVIRVAMRLTDRHIEIARDMKSDSCRFPKLVAHYQHHAAADVAVFQRYVVEVTATLAHLPVSSFTSAYETDRPRQNIARVTQTIIEPVLRAMDAARDTEPSLVDTPAEVEELEAACTDHAFRRPSQLGNA